MIQQSMPVDQNLTVQTWANGILICSYLPVTVRWANSASCYRGGAICDGDLMVNSGLDIEPVER
jgi:hypothetical protein